MTEKTTLTREEFAELISQRNSYYKAWKEAEKKLSEAQAIIEQQKKTFIAALNNATKISSTELQIAERLKAESSPEALESERAANAILTEELEKAREDSRSRMLKEIIIHREIFPDALFTLPPLNLPIKTRVTGPIKIVIRDGNIGMLAMHQK